MCVCASVSRCCNPAYFPLFSALTAEQYQQHQEQLALMQKQQLEQIQLQQQANSTTTANSTVVSILWLHLSLSLFLSSPSSLTLSLSLSSWTPEPGEHVGPGQRSVRRLGPRHRRPTAVSENQGGASPGRRSQWRPLPLRYDTHTRTHTHKTHTLCVFIYSVFTFLFPLVVTRDN